MAVPKFYEFFRPTLALLQDGEPRHSRQIDAAMVAHFHLTAEDQAELIPSGKKTRLHDRVEWAATYLRQANLLESVGRGINRITSRGQAFLADAPAVIKPSDLQCFQEFVDFNNRSRSPGRGVSVTGAEEPVLVTEVATPEEVLDSAFEELNATLAQEVLERIKAMPPAFFERLIVQLMLRLGYGGAFGAGETLGKSGDGGVDGVINQDKLGLEKIYLQAKRWNDGTVGRKEVQSFVGALSGQGASKGVFITTSTFTREAREYARLTHNFKVSVVDGLELAKLMIEHDMGVSLVQRYDVKRIDTDFFSGE